MYKKLILMSLIVIVLAAGCFPVGQLQVGVEETPPVVVEPIETEVPETEAVEPTETVTIDPVVGQGIVEGEICFPSEFIPAMTGYFRDIDRGFTYEMAVAENQVEYGIELPAGRYIAFAYLNDPASPLSGQYSEFVACGLNVECVDHNSLPFEVQTGETTTGVNICDWYEPLAVPANPKATIETDPNLEGFHFIYRDTIYRVEAGGVAVPLVSPFQPFEIVLSTDGRAAVFNHNDDLYLADLEGSAWINLTNTPDRWEANPMFVPGGRLFFYTGTNDEERMSGHPGMVNLDGTGYQQLDLSVCCTQPSFDSSGTLMAFTSGDAAWIYDFTQGSLEQLDMEDYGISGLRYIVSPSFSPDDTKLAWWMVTGEPDASLTSLAIFDLVEKTAVRKHVYQPIGGGGANSSPRWSPDGQWLASIVLGDGARAGLWLISAGSGEEYDLGSAGEHVWSPNSGGLVYRVWPDNGGPAWESTTNLYLPATNQIVTVDLPMGITPAGYFGE